MRVGPPCRVHVKHTQSPETHTQALLLNAGAVITCLNLTEHPTADVWLPATVGVCVTLVEAETAWLDSAVGYSKGVAALMNTRAHLRARQVPHHPPHPLSPHVYSSFVGILNDAVSESTVALSGAAPAASRTYRPTILRGLWSEVVLYGTA